MELESQGPLTIKTSRSSDLADVFQYKVLLSYSANVTGDVMSTYTTTLSKNKAWHEDCNDTFCLT